MADRGFLFAEVYPKSSYIGLLFGVETKGNLRFLEGEGLFLMGVDGSMGY